MKEDVTKIEIAKEKKNNAAFYCWGVFFGWVIGMIFSKVYLLWAVWFYGEGSRIAGINGWWSNSPPLWAIAYLHPQEFNVFIIVFFILVGLFFVRFLLKNIIIIRNVI